MNIENITSGIKWWPNLIWSTSLEYNVCMMFGELSFLKNESLGKWYSPFLSWPPGYQSDCRWDITAGPCNWELLLCPPVPCANLEIKISLRTRTYLQQSILTHTYILEIDILWAFRFSWLIWAHPCPLLSSLRSKNKEPHYVNDRGPFTYYVRHSLVYTSTYNLGFNVHLISEKLWNNLNFEPTFVSQSHNVTNTILLHFVQFSNIQYIQICSRLIQVGQKI